MKHYRFELANIVSKLNDKGIILLLRFAKLLEKNKKTSQVNTFSLQKLYTNKRSCDIIDSRIKKGSAK